MEEEPRDPNDPRSSDKDSDRDAILARRRFFVAAAMAGLLTTSCAASVNTQDGATPDAGDSQPQACLTVAPDVPQPCLSDVPQPCLSPPLDVPQPCLDAVLPDADVDV